MAAFAASFLSSASAPGHSLRSSSLALRPNHSVSFQRLRFGKISRHLITVKTLVFASSDGIRAREGDSRSKKSILLELIQEIEPLDISIIQKDVPPTTIDAMKRTISGMLGLLPSDQFQVLIEALWKPLSKLLISSLMTGYTLRNAEYRLCLESRLDRDEESEIGNRGNEEIPDFGEMRPEVQEYISKLQSRLFSVKKELHEVKRKNAAAVQMQEFVGEEKNELLDYLRSLEPEKVAELSEATSGELKETIHSVVHGLLATLSPKMQSQAIPADETTPSPSPSSIGSVVQFQPLICLSRDYVARLLFWCMLLGHYLRGVEYRLQLTDLLSFSNKNNTLTNEEGEGEREREQ